MNEFNKIFERDAMYFTHIQPHQHHSNIPTKVDNVPIIYCYSFALKPEEYQPSGSCNFSRLKSVQIVSKFPDGISNVDLKNKAKTGIEVFGINYNILKITSGMAGLMFVN